MTDMFYRSLEEKFRGSRELIKRRQRVYLPFLAMLTAATKPCTALDIGCGRGEWLEVLQEAGFRARGVDLDAGMLQACTERGLDVSEGDAVATLRNLPDASLGVVSALHVAEHIPFNDLRILVEQAFRVLMPGGLLILETPNPENIVYGAVNFYVDPTHERPIPPGLLAFLPEFYGFARWKILRLQEERSIADGERVSLQDVLRGVSPDYAVVAQKDGPTELLRAGDAAFAKEYGLALDMLLGRFDAQQLQGQTELALLEARADADRERMRAEFERERAYVASQHAAAVAQLNERHFHATSALHAQVHQIHTALQAVYMSHSWRITAPLRWAARKSAGSLRLVRQTAKRGISILRRLAGRAARGLHLYDGLASLRGAPTAPPTSPVPEQPGRPLADGHFSREAAELHRALEAERRRNMGNPDANRP